MAGITTTISPGTVNNGNILMHVKRSRVELDAIEWMIRKVEQRPSSQSPPLQPGSLPFPSADFLARIEALIETVAERLTRELPETIVGIHLKRTLVTRLAQIIDKWRDLLAETDIAEVVAAAASPISTPVGGALPIATELLAGVKRATTIILSTRSMVAANARSKTNIGGGSTGEGSPSFASNSSSSPEEMTKAVEELSAEMSSSERENTEAPATTLPQTTELISSNASSTLAAPSSIIDSSNSSNSNGDDGTLQMILNKSLNGEEFALLCQLLEAKTNIELLLEMTPLSNDRLVTGFMELLRLVSTLGGGGGDSIIGSNALRDQWEIIVLHLFSRYRDLVRSQQSSSMSSSDLTSTSSLSMSVASLSTFPAIALQLLQLEYQPQHQPQQTLFMSSATEEDSPDGSNRSGSDLILTDSATSSSLSPSTMNTSSISEKLQALDRSITLFFALKCPAPEVVQRKIAQLERHIRAIPASEQELVTQWQDKLANIWQTFRLLSPAVSEEEAEDSSKQNLSQILVNKSHISSSSEMGAQGIVLNSTTTSAVENNCPTDSNAHLNTLTKSNSKAHVSTVGSSTGLRGHMEADLQALEASIEADIEAGNVEQANKDILELTRLVEVIGQDEEGMWSHKLTRLIGRMVGLL